MSWKYFDLISCLNILVGALLCHFFSFNFALLFLFVLILFEQIDKVDVTEIAEAQGRVYSKRNEIMEERVNKLKKWFQH